MPWLDTPKSGFVSTLEFFWNQHVSRMDNVLLIACGSASSWIRKNLIHARGGLYNRFIHISGVFTRHSSWKFKGNDALPGAQIDMVIDRADRIILLCEAKFTRENFALTADDAAKLRLRKTIFKQATHTKKAVFTTLLTTFPALKNKYYLEEIDREIPMERLFAP